MIGSIFIVLIGSFMPSGHVLYAIGNIAIMGGISMIAGGVVIGVVDALFHEFFAGFKKKERGQSFPMQLLSTNQK